MSLRHPLARARGLGAAKSGVPHWWMQRLSSLGLLFLLPWFAYFVAGLVGVDDYHVVRLTIAQPHNSIALVLLALTMYHHAWLGVQVVIEDYVSEHWLALALLVLARATFLVATVASVFAIVRIALGAG